MTLLNVEEVADFLHVCPNTVRNAIKSGEIPTVRVRRRVLIPKEALEAKLYEQIREQEAAIDEEVNRLLGSGGPPPAPFVARRP